jgi:hypothetical protein
VTQGAIHDVDQPLAAGVMINVSSNELTLGLADNLHEIASIILQAIRKCPVIFRTRKITGKLNIQEKWSSPMTAVSQGSIEVAVITSPW